MIILYYIILFASPFLNSQPSTCDLSFNELENKAILALYQSQILPLLLKVSANYGIN